MPRWSSGKPSAAFPVRLLGPSLHRRAAPTTTPPAPTADAMDDRAATGTAPRNPRRQTASPGHDSTWRGTLRHREVRRTTPRYPTTDLDPLHHLASTKSPRSAALTGGFPTTQLEPSVRGGPLTRSPAGG